MRTWTRTLTAVLACTLFTPALLCADLPPEFTKHGAPADFDFEIGTWKTHLRRLTKPLSGSDTWMEYEGTTVVSKVWGGRANLVELDVSGPAGRIEALSLRLFNPETRQWSLNFANARSGVMAAPTLGGFSNGRGEFYSTQGDDKCMLDSVTQHPIVGIPHRQRTYRLIARGYCTEPARAVRGKGSVMISRFDLAGRVDFDVEDSSEDTVVAAARPRVSP